ncbi:hypothetical protein Cgig2_012457 [Carnegiea gigantea]|uniref:Cytochrome c oxidase subunit Vb n=1 Tax=Carnegiea gigantea TaxID=171969 RepID=A0A9Q1KMK6_9CARY|nr:hypothetical protein Cgig2_012457 [Carnegiea gigantea]
MWRRLVSSHLKTLATSSSSSYIRSIPKPSFIVSRPTTSFQPSSSVFSRYFSTESDVSKPKKRVEDVMPIATGHEREELEAELEGRDILEINYPVGPFGTKTFIWCMMLEILAETGMKENPAIVKSYYDKRIVGCPGGEGEDEHDVVWFWLKKDKPYECPVCGQYFKASVKTCLLEVVGPGGDPEAGHGDDDHH